MDILKTLGLLIAVVGLVVAPIAAWVTHMVWWISLCMNEQLDTVGEGVLAVLGTIVPPVGVIHGFILWF